MLPGSKVKSHKFLNTPWANCFKMHIGSVCFPESHFAYQLCCWTIDPKVYTS